MIKALIYAWWQVIKCNYKNIAFSILLSFSILTPVCLLLLMVLRGMSPLNAAPRAMIVSLVASAYFSVNIHLFNAVAGYVLWRYMGFEPDYTVYGVPMIDLVKAVERMRLRRLAVFTALYALFLLPAILALRTL